MNRQTKCSYLLCLVIVGLFFEVRSESPSSVEILTDENFDEKIHKGVWLVDFYAPWCGHCKQLAPIFDETSELLRKENIPLQLGKVDCTVHTGVASRFNIRGYPTLKVFRNGQESTEYEGGRSVASFKAFAKKMTSPTIEKLDESPDPVNSFRQLITENPVVFLYIGDNKNDKSTFVSVGEIYFDSATFATISNEKAASLIAQIPALKPDSLFLFNDVNHANPERYSEPIMINGVSTWVKKNKYPVFPELTGSNWNHLTTGRAIFIAFYDPADPKMKPFLQSVRKIASNHRDFAFAYMNGLEYSSLISQLGLSTSEVPTVVVLNTESELYWTYNQPNFEKSSIDKFVNDWSGGRIPSKPAGGFSDMLRRNFIWVIVVVAALFVLGAAGLYVLMMEDPVAARKKD